MYWGNFEVCWFRDHPLPCVGESMRLILLHSACSLKSLRTIKLIACNSADPFTIWSSMSIEKHQRLFVVFRWLKILCVHRQFLLLFWFLKRLCRRTAFWWVIANIKHFVVAVKLLEHFMQLLWSAIYGFRVLSPAEVVRKNTSQSLAYFFIVFLDEVATIFCRWPKEWTL